MTVRHVLLTVAALAVLGLGLYLFFEVRAAPVPPPATAEGSHREKSVVATRAPDDAPAKTSGREPPVQVRDARPTADARPTTQAAPPALTRDAPALNGTEVQKLDAIMSEASKAYDRGDFEDSKVIAEKALATDPNNVRMLRIMVSASCIDGDSVVAQKFYLQLPGPDRDQMKIRCARYGVSFNES